VTPLPADATVAPPDLSPEGAARRRFFRAPQSVAGFWATVLDPVVILLSLWTLHLWEDPSFSRWVTALSLMVIALTFPGRTRLDGGALGLAADIVLNWLVLLGTLYLCVVVTRSADDVDWQVLQRWALVTPAVHWLATCALVAGTRWQARRDGAVRPVVLIGAAALALRTAQAIGQLEGPRRRVVGFFDDRNDTRIGAEARALRLGHLHDAARYVDKLGIREVYITLPMASHARMAKLLDALQGTTASLYFVPDVLGTHIVQGRLQDLQGLPVVGICETPFTGINETIKRGSDLLLALLLLVISLPLLLLVAAALKLDSPGPVLNRQRRSGLDGEEIIVFKFRTTAVQRNPPDGPTMDQSTRLGRGLRRWCLDSLPQLLNVLQGRMSMVGPRPHAVAHNALYRQQIKGYMVRHKARPGITGWAQIHGRRGEDESLEAMRQRVAYDLEYLRNWSLGLDLRILLRTLRTVLAGALART
jgi:putative colanic acid biosysnthesis UDP-glucose lipid carrier transferase